MRNQSSKRTRAILALVGACFYQFAVLGTFVNSHGVYMAKIRETVGLSMTAISLNTTIRNVAGALLASTLTMLFYKKNPCRVMFLSLLSVVACYLLMIISAGNFLWYVIPILLTPVASITVLAVPHVMLQWFPKKSGTAAGLAMAFSGLGGAVCNPVAAALCSAVGWQWTIVIIGIFSMALGSAGLYLMFILKGEPESTETAVSGKKSSVVEGVHAPVALRFILCVLTVFVAASSVMVANISIHMEELNYSLAVGASVTSAVMIGNISGKLIFGWVSDKIGIWRSFIILSILVGLGALILGLNRSSIALMYVGGLFFGMCYFCGTIGIAKCSLAAYGTELTKKYSGYHAGINSAVSATLAFLVGPVFDKLGSFTPVFVFLACVALVSCISAFSMFLLSKKKA